MGKIKEEVLSIQRSIRHEKQFLKDLDDSKFVAKLVKKAKTDTRLFIKFLKRKETELKQKLQEQNNGNKGTED